MTIGILGGTGDFGRGLATRLRTLGEDVLVGSRTPREGVVANAEAATRAELVFLSVPPTGVESTARDLAAELAGRIVVSVASPVVFRDGRPSLDPGERSLAETAAEAAPEARVVAGFHTIAAKALARPDPLDEDVLLCGDDADAKATVARLAERIVAGRALDCGRLEAAGWLETLTALLLTINKNYKSETGVRITGL
ncbi:MAG: NAD(P)-binding domain-containing protein [Actinobacteria bacterium]|nr:NAD(P)-binding domain-containing protein [Actinomycetota bacterium]